VTEHVFNITMRKSFDVVTGYKRCTTPGNEWIKFIMT